MDISKFLSKVIGIYLVIISIAMLINMAQFSGLINDLINNAPLMFVTGFTTLILGILMVVSHNIWQRSWQLIITLLSWNTLLKGISLIFYPQIIGKVSFMFLHNTSIAYAAAGFDLVLGMLLIYFGFKNNIRSF